MDAAASGEVCVAHTNRIAVAITRSTTESGMTSGITGLGTTELRSCETTGLGSASSCAMAGMGQASAAGSMMSLKKNYICKTGQEVKV